MFRRDLLGGHSCLELWSSVDPSFGAFNEEKDECMGISRLVCLHDYRVIIVNTVIYK